MSVLTDFRDILLTADPEASHYHSEKRPNYTVWAEYGEQNIHANNKSAVNVVKIQIDRYTENEYDPMVDNITGVLEEADNIAFSGPENNHDSENGRLHYIWDCEVF